MGDTRVICIDAALLAVTVAKALRNDTTISPSACERLALHIVEDLPPGVQYGWARSQRNRLPWWRAAAPTMFDPNPDGWFPVYAIKDRIV